MQIFKTTVVNGCKAPPATWKEIAKRKHVDLSKACDLIYNFYKWTRGGVYNKYNKGDTVFLKTKRGVLVDGFVSQIRTARKQIDWSYDIIDKHGNLVQSNATAKRVLERKAEEE